MLLHHGIRCQRRIAKTQTRNFQTSAFDRKLLNISIAQWIVNHLMLHWEIQFVCRKKSVNRFRRNLHHVAALGQRSIKKRKLRANRIIQFRIPKPGKIIVISWNSRRLRHMKTKR